MPRLKDADAASIFERMRSMPDDAVLTPAEVAALMRVDPKTVTRWAGLHKIDAFRTPGGHRRFRVGSVRAHLERETAA